MPEFDKTNHTKHKQNSLLWLKNAEQYWATYAGLYSQKNAPALYNRVGYQDVNALKTEVKKDYDIVNSWKPNSITHKVQKTTEKPFNE